MTGKLATWCHKGCQLAWAEKCCTCKAAAAAAAGDLQFTAAAAPQCLVDHLLLVPFVSTAVVSWGDCCTGDLVMSMIMLQANHNFVKHSSSSVAMGFWAPAVSIMWVTSWSCHGIRVTFNQYISVTFSKINIPNSPVVPMGLASAK